MKTTRILALLLALCLVVGCIPAAFAATIDEATIDTTKTASLTLYKYDFTNAAKDGIWTNNSYVSTGVYDQAVFQPTHPSRGATGPQRRSGQGLEESLRCRDAHRARGHPDHPLPGEQCQAPHSENLHGPTAGLLPA